MSTYICISRRVPDPYHTSTVCIKSQLLLCVSCLKYLLICFNLERYDIPFVSQDYVVADASGEFKVWRGAVRETRSRSSKHNKICAEIWYPYLLLSITLFLHKHWRCWLKTIKSMLMCCRLTTLYFNELFHIAEGRSWMCCLIHTISHPLKIYR